MGPVPVPDTISGAGEGERAHAPDISSCSPRKVSDILLVHVQSHQSMESLRGGLPGGEQTPVRDDPLTYRPDRRKASIQKHLLSAWGVRMDPLLYLFLAVDRDL